MLPREERHGGPVPRIRINLPNNFAYPVAKNAFSLAMEMNNLVYLPGIVSKIDALRNVLITLCIREWMPRETRAYLLPRTFGHRFGPTSLGPAI